MFLEISEFTALSDKMSSIHQCLDEQSFWSRMMRSTVVHLLKHSSVFAIEFLKNKKLCWWDIYLIYNILEIHWWEISHYLLFCSERLGLEMLNLVCPGCTEGIKSPVLSVNTVKLLYLNKLINSAELRTLKVASLVKGLI